MAAQVSEPVEPSSITPVLCLTCFVLLLTSAVNVVTARKTKDTSNSYSAGICFIAGCAYLLMIHHPEHLSLWRNIDWLLTCPLLILEFTSMRRPRTTQSEACASATAIALVFTALMILVGWGARPSVPRTLASFACLLIVSCALGRSMKTREQKSPQHDSVVIFFFLLWFFYGLVVLLPSARLFREASFSALDVATKAMFGLVVAHLALSETAQQA